MPLATTMQSLVLLSALYRSELLATWVKPIATAQESLAHQQTMLPFRLRYDRKLPGLIRDEHIKLSDRVAQQCSTCYGRNGTIASRSINRGNNIEGLVTFKEVQFALGSPNRYEFNSGAKRNERQRKTWTRTCTTFPPQNVKTRKFSDVSCCSHAN